MAIFSPFCLRLCRVVRVTSGISRVLAQAWYTASIRRNPAWIGIKVHPTPGDGTPIVPMGGHEVNCVCYRPVTGVTANLRDVGLRKGCPVGYSGRRSRPVNGQAV